MRPSGFGLFVDALSLGVAAAYHNVVRAAAPDPSIVYANGHYYMTYTSSTHIEMIRSTTLKGLLIGSVRVVYFDANITRNANLVCVVPYSEPHGKV